MPHEEHAEFVYAAGKYLVTDKTRDILHGAAALRRFNKREDGAVARVIRIVDGRPVHDTPLVFHRQVIGDGD